jgi:hypothetical protein
MGSALRKDLLVIFTRAYDNEDKLDKNEGLFYNFMCKNML